MAKLYYSKYDVFVDDQKGIILDLCTCPPIGECEFKNSWTNDGSPHKLTAEQIEELKNDPNSLTGQKQH